MRRELISFPKSGRSRIRFGLHQIGLGDAVRFHHDGFEFNDGAKPPLDFSVEKRVKRIKPEDRIVFLKRDPRDVIVSCYFQNLRLNAINANFLSLERTAVHYADLMDVWLRMRELGGFDWIETRYEDIVAGLEAEGRRVTEFLGLSWQPQQAAFHESNRKKFVFSPTYTEVTQPVYQRAVGRWRNYAEALAPIQARVAPYCRAFNYES